VDTAQANIDKVLIQSQAGKQSNNAFFNVIDAPAAAEPYQVTTKDLLRNGGIAFVLMLLALIAIILVGTWTDQAIYTLNDISSLALDAEDGDAPELLVGLVPYVPTLAAIRRKDVKDNRPGGGKRRRGKGEPTVTVVTGTDIISRPGSSNGDGPTKRPPDALPDIAASASVRR
jgi:hypothetical protein